MIKAEQYPLKEFEELKLFEGCMPIEEMARRGLETMRYGPLKPVGLVDPKTGQQPFAVVQLRQDNRKVQYIMWWAFKHALNGMSRSGYLV